MSRFVPNPRFNPKELEGVQRTMRASADDIAAAAESAGQRISASYTTSVDEDGDKIRVSADTDPLNAASWIEWGTQTLPASAPLRKAAEAAGLDPKGGKS